MWTVAPSKGWLAGSATRPLIEKVGGTFVTARQAENSEVLFAASVAVAVTNEPIVRLTGKVVLMVALPPASVVTLDAPRKVWPSPLPDASHEGLEKNSTRKVVEAVELSVP